MGIFNDDICKKIRRIFFDIIVEIFQKYKENIKINQYGNPWFDIKGFLKISSEKYK